MENLIKMLQTRCKNEPDEAAFLIKKNEKWNPIPWSEVDEKVEKIAAGLLSLGLEYGDAVSILGNTRLEWTLTDLGVLKAGCVSIGIYQTLSGEQCAYILKDSQSKVLFLENAEQLKKVKPYLDDLPDLKWIIIWDGENNDQNVISMASLMEKGDDVLAKTPKFVQEVEDNVRSSDVAIIIYTSGTTGPPKGACLTHENILAEIEAINELMPDQYVGKIMMFFLPLSHVGERVAGQYMRIHRGITAAYVEDINHILDDIVEIRPTFFGSVPRIFEKAYARIQSEVDTSSVLKQSIFRWCEKVGRKASKIKQEGKALPPGLLLQNAIADRLVFKKIRDIFGGRVKYFLSSSAPIAVEILEFFHACGMLVLEGYGQTEVSCFCTLCSPENYRFGSVGKSFPGAKLKIADDGEILVKGNIVFKGYHNQPELNDATLTSDGWIYTGDLGRIDSDGYLWITGRKKEIIITAGGKNVTPSNIEFLLMNHPLIELAMVHGDRRKYLTSLISLSPENLTTWADTHGHSNSSYGELIQLNALKSEIQKIVDRANSHLARFETIKKYAITPQPFQVETGELTPTMKVKRKIVEKKYKELLNSLYEE